MFAILELIGEWSQVTRVPISIDPTLHFIAVTYSGNLIGFTRGKSSFKAWHRVRIHSAKMEACLVQKTRRSSSCGRTRKLWSRNSEIGRVAWSVCQSKVPSPTAVTLDAETS